MQYDLTDYTQELDYERRELESEEYNEWLDSVEALVCLDELIDRGIV